MRSMLFGVLFLVFLSGELMAAGCDDAVIFEDRNGNGQQERDEPGIAGVQVSDGEQVVRSDTQGRYHLPLQAGRTHFVIKPAGYRLPNRSNGLPDFWHQQPPASRTALRYGGLANDTVAGCRSYALIAEPASTAYLEVLIFGDPQPKNLRNVDHYARDIVAPLRQAEGGVSARLGVTLGDVVDDDLSLYPAINRVTTSLGVPWLHAAGNHDLDFDAAHDEDSLHSFRREFGPDSFVWEEPQANIIVLDNVIYQPGKTPQYIGGLREQQFTFLEAYLAAADRKRLLVVAAHIPFFDPDPTRETFRRADRKRLFALLKDFPKVLLLTSHTHRQNHYFHGAESGWAGAQPLHEYNVGASGGAFWSGVADAEGIPDSTMSDGTPNGYARMRVAADGSYRLRWHVARDPELDVGIALHAPMALRHGSYPAFGVYANVFMGHADSVVEYRINDAQWQPMRRVLRPDPRVLIQNVADDLAESLRGFDRSPEATSSTHLWRGTLPTDLPVGEHRIEVRTRDPWRGELKASRYYRLLMPETTGTP